MNISAPNIAIIIVTYNRASMLENLLRSIKASYIQPSGVIIVDNASSDDTRDVICKFVQSSSNIKIDVVNLDVNVGGAGGFRAGVERAYNLGFEWFWLMDDDVEVLPCGLGSLIPWMDRFKCFHGRRLDFDGSPFFWQPKFSEFLGLPLPYLRDPFLNSNYFITNSGCFEGMMIHRFVVEKIGFPDSRFFITWDDAVYGWLASKVTDVGYVNEFCLKRTRAQVQINLGPRKLTAGSNLFRYHVIRNRKYVKQYLIGHGNFSSVGFFIGSVINFGKEIFRLLFVGGGFSGFLAIAKGLRDYFFDVK